MLYHVEPGAPHGDAAHEVYHLSLELLIALALVIALVTITALVTARLVNRKDKEQHQ